MDPFGSNSDLKDDIVPKDNKLSVNTKKKLLIIVGVLALIIIIVYLIIISLNKDENDEKKSSMKASEIKCLYRIDNFSKNISLLGEQYENINNTILNIFINETKIDYNKNY